MTTEKKASDVIWRRLLKTDRGLAEKARPQMQIAQFVLRVKCGRTLFEKTRDAIDGLRIEAFVVPADLKFQK
jgi:hypothetical protein